MGVSDARQLVKQVSVTVYHEAGGDTGVTCYTRGEIATIGETFCVRDIAGEESVET